MTRLLFAVFALVFATAAHAETYMIEPSHTRAEYRVSHLGFSNMPGIFNDIKGKIEFDADKVNASVVEAIIRTDSVTMNNTVLDQKLKGRDFFNTQKYPVMVFKSTEIEKTGLDRGVMKGNLTLLGVTKPVTLKVKFNKKAWNKYQGVYAMGFTAWTSIRRSDFGMKYILPDVGDDVKIRLEVEALQAKPNEVFDLAAQVKIINTPKVETKPAAANPVAPATETKPAATNTVQTPDSSVNKAMTTAPQRIGNF